MTDFLNNTRRNFLKGAAVIAGGALLDVNPLYAADAARREVKIGGKRIKTVDVHSHCVVDARSVVQGTPYEKAITDLISNRTRQDLQATMLVKEDRVAFMNKMGIDVEVLTINSFWYDADRDIATRLIDEQNRQLAQIPKTFHGRFEVLATAALQFPDLAAQQLETAMKEYGHKGVGIGSSVSNTMELSDPKLDVFWAKCQELNAFIFMHPLNAGLPADLLARLKGNGLLSNSIGNPLDTSIGLAHMIFDGTFDKFPNLRICGAHGGGFIASYPDRFDNGCLMMPTACVPPGTLKKKPTDYVKGLYVDSLVFSSEALRHLIATTGVSQIMIGTDCPFPWTFRPVDHILGTPGISNADRIAILGGNACRLMNIPTAV